MKRAESFPLPLLIFVVAVALIGRVLLIASNTVSFHSDEAVVALMARHILEGARPTFFYSQAYMGSLDAWLVAVGFALFGQTVTAIRLVQGALYLLIVASGFIVAWKASHDRITAAAVGLILAIPSVLFATYSAATLGGYNESLLLGNLTLIIALDLAGDHARSRGRWLLLGLIVGIGWWTNGLIAVYALTAILLILAEPFRSAVRYLRQIPLQAFRFGEVMRPFWGALAPIRWGVLLGAAGFVIGAAPWWVFALQNDFAPLAFLTGGSPGGEFAGTDVFSLPLGERLIGYFFIGLPTLIGMRFPWNPGYFAPLIGLLVASVVIYAAVRVYRGKTLLTSHGQLLIAALVIVFSVVYLVSRFSFDPTGRYFLPLVLPVALVIGALVGAAWKRRRIFAVSTLALVLAYQAAGQITTASTEPGFTTQFNLDTHIPNDQDAALITFLDEHGITRGYSQYWISLRLAFLTGERVQLSAALPYLPSLRYTPMDERYPAYRAAADAAENPALIIAETSPNVAVITEALEAWLDANTITCTQAEVGMYRVYYACTSAPRPPFALETLGS